MSHYLSLGSMKNEKQIRFLKKVCDLFDNNRGSINEDLAVTLFREQTNHKILMNTMSPKLNGKQLVMVNNNDGILLAPVDIESVICSDKRNNTDINLIIQKNNKNTWNAVSNEARIKILIRFPETPVTIAGFSIQFEDTTRTNYLVSIDMANEGNEMLSQILGMKTSRESNGQQFFQFSQPVEGVFTAVLDLEVTDTNIFEWKVKNISLYSQMNQGALKSLGDSGSIVYSQVPNMILIKEGIDQEQFEETQEQPLKIQGKMEHPLTIDTSQVSDNFDSYGTPLIAAPNRKHQYFDNLSDQEMIKISNKNRIYSITDTQNGHSIYTFETDPNTKNLTLTFSPQTELNRNTDEVVTQFESLVKKGYMRYGGFKNYCLTLYIKLDGITMDFQNLIWKYGGWLFNDSLPDRARATDVYIPVGAGKVRVCTEYSHNRFIEINDNINASEFDKPVLPDGKWIGLQFIRKVVDTNKAVINVRINTDPMTDEGRPKKDLGDWQPIFAFDDVSTDEHTANTWGGINEIITVSGAKYVSLYGISLYELEW